ncbi:LacI family DNA-binding transcriptional regulator [Agromyces sp. ZXT2-3]|uniref:LacI family DNA-binding transcriptional regulator n=1 Tax=Agromyces sp. ZXT2-3 TaxID=3461152 RepID=UPI0040550037
MPDASRARPETRRGPSIADVAKVAGVSAQTVSRVSNEKTNVDPATRDRVLAAMHTVGYKPNRAARALRTGRFRSIGVITFTLSTFGNMRTLDAITTAAADADHTVTVIRIPDPTTGNVSGAYRRLSEQAVDGVIIIFEAHLLDRAEISLPADQPVVIIDSNAGDGFTIVDTDQAQGARQATEHLLGLGHRTVWHIAGPDTSFSGLHRARAWAATLREHGITPPPAFQGDWTTDSGYRIGTEIAARGDITAVFAANDQMALGAMQAFHEAGLAIPGDISIVGFDDMEESKAFWPPLTTIRQDFAEVGRLCIEKLMHEIETKTPEPGRSFVPTTLVVRKSTAPPGADAS